MNTVAEDLSKFATVHETKIKRTVQGSCIKHANR